ncbi:hypothetical protein CCP2SC5_10072 [Azospirillaceae bacterium]
MRASFHGPYVSIVVMVNIGQCNNWEETGQKCCLGLKIRCKTDCNLSVLLFLLTAVMSFSFFNLLDSLGRIGNAEEFALRRSLTTEKNIFDAIRF